jgi:Tol biopolymer transport system component
MCFGFANRRVWLGHFHSPKKYTGEWRCDTHPRFSPDGNFVCIDSAHAGGRQMYRIDIRGLAV